MAELRFKRKVYKIENRKGVVFFYPALMTRLWWYRITIRALQKRGLEVIGYDYQARTMLEHGDVAHGLAELARMLKDAQEQLDDIPSSVPVYAVGTSMGTIFALRLAKNNPQRIKKLVINVPYGTIANNIWTWRFFASVKKILIPKGYTEETLFEELKPVETTWEIEKLDDKSIYLMISKVDHVQRNTMFFYKRANARNKLAHVRYNRFTGHYIGGAWNMLNYGRWLKFLRGVENPKQSRRNWSGRAVLADGHKVPYYISGDLSADKLVLLVPGYGESGPSLWRAADYINSKGHAVLTYDQPYDNNPDVQKTAQWGALTIEAIFGELELPNSKKFEIIGHSAGGDAAIGFAIAHPERVRSITFLTSMGLGANKKEEIYGKWPGVSLLWRFTANGLSLIKYNRSQLKNFVAVLINGSRALLKNKRHVLAQFSYAVGRDFRDELLLLRSKNIIVNVITADRDKVFLADAVEVTLSNTHYDNYERITNQGAADLHVDFGLNGSSVQLDAALQSIGKTLKYFKDKNNG